MKPFVAVVAVALVAFLVRKRIQNSHHNFENFRKEFQAQYEEIDGKFRHYQRLVNGTNWHFVEEGNPEGPVVLFIHGFPESWYVWSHMLPQIDARYRLIAIDLKGFGRSTTTNSDYDWHAVADQIQALMTTLQIEKYFLVSHDWGTLIGSVLAHDYQSHLLGFVRMQVELTVNHRYDTLLGKFNQFIARPQFLIFQSQWLMEVVMADRAKFLTKTYQERMTTPFKARDRDFLTYEYSRSDLVASVLPYVHYSNWDFETAMDRICRNDFPFPVLQLQANQDHTQPNSWFDHVPSECRRVQLQWIEGAGHFDMFDQPEAIVAAINSFLARHYPSLDRS